jgi:pimeloyl-ACP methyl ester carboxylesterase
MFSKRFIAVAFMAAFCGWFTFKSYTFPIASPSGIAELRSIPVNDDRQWLLARGCDADNPVLLFIHGGPGMSAMYLAHEFQRPLERDFVVVHWDQRGAGKSFRADLDPDTMRISQFVADAEVVIASIRRRFGQRKIILVGHSHGTYLGPILAQKRPDLFHAYVGLGQLGDPELLRAEQDRLLTERLSMFGREAPPISSANREALLFEAGGELAEARSMWPLLLTGLVAPEYSLFDALNVAKGPRYAARHLKYDLNGGNSGPPQKLDLPVYVFMGEHDLVTPVSLARRWLDGVSAPSKSFDVVPNAAHFVHFERPEEFAALMRRVKADVGILSNSEDSKLGFWRSLVSPHCD